jgi:putative endonuclease
MPVASAAARWRILACDWRCPVGEIDILARRGGILAVIEVKSRSDFAAGAAEAYLLMRPDLATLALRFDVMVVAPRRLPRHLQGAWLSDD